MSLPPLPEPADTRTHTTVDQVVREEFRLLHAWLTAAGFPSPLACPFLTGDVLSAGPINRWVQARVSGMGEVCRPGDWFHGTAQRVAQAVADHLRQNCRTA